jgi:chromosomal replication initiator protein
MTMENEKRWQDVLAEIRKTLRKQQYDTWFKRVRFESAGGEEVQLIVPNRFFADWLETHYRQTVEDAVRRALGSELRVRFEVGSSVWDPAQEEPAAEERRVQIAPVPQLNKTYQLDTFVAGKCNRLAQAAARSVAESPGTVYNPLFVHGGAGTGKTHLLQAICHRFMALHAGEGVAYVPAHELTAELVQAKEEDTLNAFRARYRSVSLLALDDLQQLAGKEGSQDEFFHIFNDLHSQKRQVVVCGDRAPQDIAGLSERLVSRLRWGLVAKIEDADCETRLAILRRKAASQRVKPPDDVLEYLASTAVGSIRELEAALLRVLAVASLSGKEPSVAAAREAFASAPARPSRPITVPQIQDAVARQFAVRKEDLVSKKRSRSMTAPRQVGMYLAGSLTDAPPAEIGQMFGGRDPAKALLAFQKIEREKAHDPKLAQLLEAITAQLAKGDRPGA